MPWAVDRRVWLLVAGGVASAGRASWCWPNSGADFVPRIAEGDAVVTVRRAPSIGFAQAKELDLAAERVLRRFPEVVTSLGMTGRAEVAIDPVGNDNTDIFVHLKPEKEWTSAHDLDELSELFKHAIESEVAGTFVSVSQPIEDKTNELISGSRADVQIALFGESLTELKRLSEETAALVRDVPGSGDVRVERLLGAPELTVTPDRARLARYGIKTEDALGGRARRASGCAGRPDLRRPAPLRHEGVDAAELAEPGGLGRSVRRSFRTALQCHCPRSRRSKSRKARRKFGAKI